MADELTTIATNHIPRGRLSTPLRGAGVSQTTQPDGSLIAQLGDNTTDGWVYPWMDVDMPAGDMVGVLLLSPTDGLAPAGGTAITLDDDLIWLRGSAAGYAHAIAVRAHDLTQARLHVPAAGQPLTILKVGLFDLPSWLAMQARGILYFDGDGITTTSNDGYTLPPATATTLGGVKVDTSTLSITADGLLSALQQRIPVATADRLGGVKTGRGLRIAADGTASVKLGRNLQYDANGAIEAPDIEMPDMSDYVMKSSLTATLNSYYTKELADATFQKKDSSGSGGGSTVTSSLQMMQLQHDKSETDGLITNNAASPNTVPFGSTTVSIGPGTNITGITNGLKVSKAGYYRLSGRIHYNLDAQGTEAGLVCTPRILGMNGSPIGRFAFGFWAVANHGGKFPASDTGRYDVVGVLPTVLLDLGAGASITVDVYLRGTASHNGFLAGGSYLNLEWVADK